MTIKTNVTVRVIAKGGKFIGSDIGGAFVTLKNAETGAILACGKTQGGSGEEMLMDVALKRTQSLPVNGASLFNHQLDLKEPMRIEAIAEGPLRGLQSANRASATQWLIPGKDLTGGNGLMLELPGLLVQVLEPFTDSTIVINKIAFTVSISMLCGNLISNNPEIPWWTSDQFRVGAIIKQLDSSKDDVFIADIPLNYSNQPGIYTGTWQTPENSKGKTIFYEAFVYALQPANGNSGMGRVTFTINLSK
jgi:hypothetical protein